MQCVALSNAASGKVRRRISREQSGLEVRGDVFAESPCILYVSYIRVFLQRFHNQAGSVAFPFLLPILRKFVFIFFSDDLRSVTSVSIFYLCILSLWLNGVIYGHVVLTYKTII